MSATWASLPAVLLAGAAAATWVGPRLPTHRLALLERKAGQVGPAHPGSGRPAGGVRGGRAAAGLAALGVLVLVGGPVGAVLAGVVALLGPRWLGRLEPAAVRRRRLRAARDLPVAADLLAACLAAGSPPEAALAAVATAVAGPVGSALDAVVVSMRLGADPRTAWRPFVRHPDLGPLARAVARALDTGSPLAGVVERCADDLRAGRRSSAEQAARAVAVRAAAPLGLCFLPAFVLLGVVPTVLGLAGGLLG